MLNNMLGEDPDPDLSKDQDLVFFRPKHFFEKTNCNNFVPNDILLGQINQIQHRLGCDE